VAALKAHLEDNFFYRIDLSKFYTRLNLSRVTRCLKHRFPYPRARNMAHSSVVQNPDVLDRYSPMVPFGFPQSPIIASMCLRHSALGNYLHCLSTDDFHTVSVYMDDILISTKALEPLNVAAEKLSEKAARSRLPLNEDKCEGPAESVCAFNIILTKGALEIHQDRLAELSERYCSTSDDDVRAGIVGYVKSVNSTQAKFEDSDAHQTEN